MAKTFGLQFGTGNPATASGLSPTFIAFVAPSLGTTLTPPGVTEVITGTGLYSFVYGATTAIIFTIDGGAALADSDRYVTGTLDPVQTVDERLGWATDSFGTTVTDPTTVFGHARRNQEFNEGNATYNKSAATWFNYSRGSSVLLFVKTLTNTSSAAGKT